MDGLKPQRSVIQAYINNFRRGIASFLKADIGLKCVVYPARSGGAVLRFEFGRLGENEDVYKMAVRSVNKALEKIPQKAFGGNLEGFNFKGTNIIMEPSAIIIIKDGALGEWSESAVKADIQRILPNTVRG